MYQDFISYQLAEGIDQKHLLSVAEQVFDQWMKHQEGFIRWEINQNEDGSYTDVVSWSSKEAAKQAEENMENIPNGGQWFACYKEGSISSKHLTVLQRFSK